MNRADFDSLPPDFITDPYRYYSRLRAMNGVHLSPQGVWILTRYEDVALVLRDPRFGRKGFRDLLGTGGAESRDAEIAPSMLFQDPPNHTRLRTLVGKAFTHRLIDDLRPRIEQIVDRLLDRVWNARAMDLIDDFAFLLPVDVISEMLGIPAADRDLFRQWSLDIARGLEGTSSPVFERGAAAHDAIADYFSGLIDERRKRPQADLLTGLIAAKEEPHSLSESELIATCGLLFVAGHETTVNLIGNGMLALFRHPAELRRLREHPGLLPSAVEELLRYDSPVQRIGRVSNTDVEIGGRMIPKGAILSAIVGAANRDPAQFREPDRLDIIRRDNRHLALGWGVHFCLGAQLARVEGQIAIGKLVRHLPNLRLVTDAPEWRTTTEVRGLKNLQVTF